MLARREYSSSDLSEALLRKGYTPDAVNGALGVLKAERMLEDARYAEGLVRALTRRGQGGARIRQALTKAGIDPEGAEAALSSGPDLAELAEDVRRRKFGVAIPRDWAGKARQMRFLQYRGFSSEQISRALSGAGMEEESGPED
jgi:regulatory protein